jgi:hypothetical protein
MNKNMFRKKKSHLLPVFLLVVTNAYPRPKECCGIDTDINTAVVTQTQIAVPISIGDWNSAWFGGAGTQSTYQSQYSDVDQITICLEGRYITFLPEKIM